MHQYSKLFECLGEIRGEYEIKLKSRAEPYALNVPRKVPFPMLEKTKQELSGCCKWELFQKLISQLNGVLPW